jgi:hypothetical protein
MALTELLPVVNQLSHQEKLRLIHFLLLAIAKEDGYELQTTEIDDQETLLLKQLEADDAVIWSPYDDLGAAQALSNLLDKTKKTQHA